MLLLHLLSFFVKIYQQILKDFLLTKEDRGTWDIYSDPRIDAVCFQKSNIESTREHTADCRLIN
jgi:hypothetical protein